MRCDQGRYGGGRESACGGQIQLRVGWRLSHPHRCPAQIPSVQIYSAGELRWSDRVGKTKWSSFAKDFLAEKAEAESRDPTPVRPQREARTRKAARV